MNIEEAKLYLEHTSKDDFNLEEWQKENRYQAIQVILKEIERLNKENTILRQNSQYLVKQKDELEEEIERLNMVIKAIRNYCLINELYSTNETIKEIINQKANSEWLKRLAS